MTHRPGVAVQLPLWLMGHLALGVAIWSASPGAETVWFHVARWLGGIQDADSWKPIGIAYARAAEGTRGIYDAVFFSDGVKFQYPLTALALAGGLDRSTLNVLSWAAVVITSIASAFALRAAIAATPSASAAGFRREPALFLATALAVLTFYPVMKGYSLGQIQTWVTAAFALLLVAWQQGRKAAAGVALGLMLLIKPSCAPLLLWGVARRQWRFVGVALVTVTAGVLASLPRYPLHEQLDYLRVLSFIGARGEVFFPNQSVNGVLNRWVSGGGSLDWQAGTFAEPHPLVAFGTMTAFVLLIGAALWLVPRHARGTPLDLSISMLASTMGAPIAWEHHYGILAPALAAAWPDVAVARAFGRFTGAVWCVDALVLANYFQVANRFDGTRFTLVQSYLLGAALVMFALLLRTTRRQAA